MDAPELKDLFLEALDRPAGREREAYLDEHCRGNAALRAQVVALLAEHERVGGFMASATVGETTSRPSSPDEEIGQEVGPYKLLQPIGEGGMGTVWIAEQTTPVKRVVALKVIKAGMDSKQVLARFKAERQALALMDHPNIAKVLDAGSTDAGRPYFVMELVKGLPITTYCDENRLTPRERLELFIPVCQAVQHAHQKGVIHRDLKPSNVLVGLYDGRPVPKVIDFGVAKAAGSTLTEATLTTAFGAIIGTLEYMSPEQARLDNIDIDTRSDIYSLGVLLYELLTGGTPLQRKRLKQAALLEILRVVREEESQLPSSRLSTMEDLPSIAANRNVEPRKLTRLVRGELDWIVMKALEKDRSRRYETADAFSADLMGHLTDGPVKACPPSAWYRFGKFARRNRRTLVTAGIVALALIVGTAVSIWQAVEASRAAQAASKAEGEALVNQARALQEEKRAKKSASESQAILEFLQSKVLAAARPKDGEGGLGKDATIRDAVVAAVPEIERVFASQPEVEAAIRNTLGETFRLLGDENQAIQQQEQALKIFQAVLAPDDPSTLKAMEQLGLALLDADRLDRATILIGDVLRLRKARLGPDHPDTLIAMHNVAATYAGAGRIDDAISLYEEVLKLSKAKVGPKSYGSAMTMNCLAIQYRNNGRLDLAIPLLEEAFKILKAEKGTEHRSTLLMANNLADAYWRAGRLAEAIPLYEKTLKLIRANLGPDHPQTLDIMNNLAMAYLDAERPEAVKLLEETFNLTRTKQGPDHPDTLWIMNNVAQGYLKTGRLADSIPLFEETLRLRTIKLGRDQPDTLVTMNSLIRAYLAAKNWGKAATTARECLQLRAKVNPDSWRYFASMSQLGVALAGQKQYAEAESFLIEGYEGLKARGTKIPALSKNYLTEAGARIVPFYEAWGKPEKAAEWRTKLAVKQDERSPAKK